MLKRECMFLNMPLADHGQLQANSFTCHLVLLLTLRLDNLRIICYIYIATAAILCQNAHHTPAYWWRGDSVMKPIGVWGWLWGHDGQRPMGKFDQDAGVSPLSFFKYILGCLMTTESAGLTNTSSSSNLVFPIGLPSRYWPGSTLLSFSGRPVLGCRVINFPNLIN